MRYRYVKAQVKVQEYGEGRRKFSRLLPSILVTLGSVLIANVAWPIVSHELLVSPKIRREPILSPLQSEYIDVVPQSNGVSMTLGKPDRVLGLDVDYTQAKNWFPTAQFGASETYGTDRYKISIPAVDVEDAEVIIGGESLEEGLIQYPGTAEPGQLGSPVIFGHSILRQFYAPSKSNPDRYMSIFSKIMTLDEGDEILVDYDGIQYVYKVREKVEVQPEDVFILQQKLNNRELKLITCVPEGTYLRRGVVIAELVDLNTVVGG
jgi:sortase A